MQPPQVETFTGERCPLLMSRSSIYQRGQLRGLVADTARVGDSTASRPGSALRDMIASLNAQGDKDSFWGDGGVKGASGAAKRRQRLAPLQDARLRQFAVKDANSHLRQSWPHALQRVKSSTVYPQLNGGWACDECGEGEGDYLWHCFHTGNFDLCDACLELGRGFADEELDDEPLPDLDDPVAQPPAQPVPDGTPTLTLAQAEPEGEPDRQAFFQVYRQVPALLQEEELVGGPPGAAGEAEPATEEATAAAGGTSEDAERMRLTKLYHTIDADHSGSVDTKELWEGLAAAGVRINREATKGLISKADVDGDGELSLEEFVEIFTTSSKMAKMGWGESEMVYAAPELAAVTGTAIMKRGEVNERVWAYIKAEDLISGSEKRPDDQWIEWDFKLLRVFAPPEPAADESGGGDKKGKGKKKKKGKKDDKPPGIKRWDLQVTMDQALDRMLSAVYRPQGDTSAGLAAEASVVGDGDDDFEEQGPENPQKRGRIKSAVLKLSPRTAYVADINQSKLAPLPLLVGKVKNRHLDLRSYGIAAGQASALAKGLEHMQGLTSVDLSMNKMADESLAAIVAALSRKKELGSLALTHNDAGRATARALESLLGQPAFLVGLTTLDLTECKLQCGGAKALATGVLGNATLTKLTLKRNGIGAVGAVALGEALALNSTVLEVDLSWNVIRGRGAVVLAKSLKENKSLRRLSLAWNCLHDEGGVAFGDMLAENSGLRYLDLSQNNLAAKSGQMLATAYQSNSTILDLQLNKNPFGLEGGRALMGALRLLGDTRVLGLAGCVFADSSGERNSAKGSKTVMFDSTRPAGQYDLELSDSYDRMVGQELRRVGATSLNPAWRKVKYNGKLMVACRGTDESPLPPGVSHTGCRFIQPVGPVCVACGLPMKLMVPVEQDEGNDSKKKKKKNKNKDGGGDNAEEAPVEMKPTGKVLNHFPDDCGAWELPEAGRLEFEFSDEAIVPIDLAPMSDSTFDQLMALIEMGDAVDLDGDGEIDEEDVLADNPEKDLRLLDIISAACTSLAFTTAQAKHVMEMAGVGPPPVWSHQVNGRWVPYPTTVRAALEAGFVEVTAEQNSPRSRSASPPSSRPHSAASSEVNATAGAPAAAAMALTIEVGEDAFVDLRRMVQISAYQNAQLLRDEYSSSSSSSPSSGAAVGAAVMREASNFPSPRVELLAAMFERLADPEAIPDLCRPLNPEEMKQLRGKLGPLWYFDERNPGGHYGPLALADSRHRRVVELLLLREAKERATRADAGAVQLGRQLRVKLNGAVVKQPLRMVPRRGLLEIDYTTSLLGGLLRTNSAGISAAGIAAASEEELDSFRQAVAEILGEQAGSEDGRMGQIRNAMKGLFFRAEQIASTAESLHLSGARLVDLICVAWGRTIDVGGYQELALGNPKVLGEPERALVHERLGILFAFDPECPDGTWRMNLALEEDHRVAEMLVTLAVKEDGENWKDEYWSEAAAPETWAVPASWIEEVPREGMLTLCFITQRWPHGDVCIKTRAELCTRTFSAEARVQQAA